MTRQNKYACTYAHAISLNPKHGVNYFSLHSTRLTIACKRRLGLTLDELRPQSVSQCDIMQTYVLHSIPPVTGLPGLQLHTLPRTQQLWGDMRGQRARHRRRGIRGTLC
jgi:hypothetical protein